MHCFSGKSFPPLLPGPRVTLICRRDEQGQTGLDRMLQLLSQLLQPSSSESGALFIGDLILHLLRNAGEYLSSVLPALLKALVERLLTAKTTTFTQVS
jgi:hypothetical protein